MDNCKPISDPETESSKKEFKHGHYYDGNMTIKAGDRLGKEGSMGLDYNQGAVRCSAIPEEWKLESGQDRGRIKEQGSHAQLEG